VTDDPKLIPKRTSNGSAGFDVFCKEDFQIKVGERKLISIGCKIECPEDMFIYIREKSGLAYKHGLEVGAGIVDSDYRNEIKVLLKNRGEANLNFKKYDAIAQILFLSVHSRFIDFLEVGELTDTERGNRGFGEMTQKRKLEEKKEHEANLKKNKTN